jgi:hypothetical protein
MRLFENNSLTNPLGSPRMRATPSFAQFFGLLRSSDRRYYIQRKHVSWLNLSYIYGQQISFSKIFMVNVVSLI